MNLTVDDFARLFGCARTELPRGALEQIEAIDWRYDYLEGEELDRVVSQLLERIRSKDFSVVRLEDKSRWLRGWAENRDEFVASNGDPGTLAPKYIRANQPVRLFHRFARPREPRFELTWYHVFQTWLFCRYFADCRAIFEFGSGSGINVARLAAMYPEKKIVGLDWAEPACEIVNAMRQINGWNTEGRVFDFFEPDETLDIPPDSAVLTVGALEQTSTRHRSFIEFLLRKRPKLCVFIEPIYEWYDPAILADHLAIRTHDVRNFWKGFPAYLRQLATEGRVEIVKEKRAEFGSLLLEGYSQTIWRPI